MNDYIEVRFDLTPCNETETDVLAALLCEIDYESFVPDESGLVAYVKKELFDELKIKAILVDFPFDNDISYKHEIVEGQDWNSEWEKNYFKPIIVKDQCVIHSSFHKDIPSLPYDIVMDPKMAFGTGHLLQPKLLQALLLLLLRLVVDMSSLIMWIIFLVETLRTTKMITKISTVKIMTVK